MGYKMKELFIIVPSLIMLAGGIFSLITGIVNILSVVQLGQGMIALITGFFNFLIWLAEMPERKHLERINRQRAREKELVEQRIAEEMRNDGQVKAAS